MKFFRRAGRRGGRIGGALGGRTAAQNMTPEERRERAKLGAAGSAAVRTKQARERKPLQERLNQMAVYKRGNVWW